MKKLFLTLILSVPGLYAMQQPAEKTINLVLGNQKFEVPQSVAFEAVTLKQMAEDLGLADDIELSAQISPEVMGNIAQIMWSYQSHNNLMGKALLDALEKDVRLKDIPLINLLQAFNYLDFPVGLALAARALAARPTTLRAFMYMKNLKDLRPLVAKYYYLLNKKDLAGVDDKSYGFSIQDYLDYQPDVIAAKRNGNQLYLSKMRLNSLEGFGRIPDIANLQWLHLNDNQLSALPAGIFTGLANLQQLDLRNNQLSALPVGVFTGLATLQWHLDLNNNQLSSLPAGIFNGLATLQRLSLYNNQLSALPAGIFNGLDNLQSLYLQNNQLSSLPAGIFNGLATLQGLFLGNNQLSILPAGIFNGLATLQQLYLNNNQLSTLPTGIFNGLATLKWLFLGNNQLSILPEGIFNGLAELQRLNFNGNQLSDGNKKELRDALPGVNIEL